jgi:GNAT superfamily N-acetyltransferase
MEVRRIQRDEAALYRKVRLTMLLDSPASFGESFAHALTLPDDYWAETAERTATSPDYATFIAFEGTQPCGAVTCILIAPPVLSAGQTGILRRATRGICPTPKEAEMLSPELYATAQQLAGQPWPDPRAIFDVLERAGLKMADIMRIAPPPREPDGSEPPPPPEDGPFGEHLSVTSGMVSGMWVSPTYRRKGIGRTLLNALIAWAIAQGAQRLELGVFESNAPAIQLYEQLGFSETRPPFPQPPGSARRFRFMERAL